MTNLITSPHNREAKPQTKKQLYTAERKESNDYSRNYAPSPVFSFSNTEMATGTSNLFDFFEDKPAMQKYGAMSNFVIQNSSSYELKLYLNQSQDRVFTIPAGVIRSFEQQEIQGGVHSIVIKNNGAGTITAGQVTIETFKVGTQIESSFQKLHKKFFKIGGF